MFSAPPPFGTTVSFTRSPGTMRVCRMAGVLSPVFVRSAKGAIHRRLAQVAVGVAAAHAFVHGLLEVCRRSMCTSWPTSRKMTVRPVS